MHPFLDSMLGWCAALAAAGALVGSGRLLRRLLRVERPGLAVEFAAGSWLVSLLLTGVGLTTGLTRSAVWSVVVASLALGAIGLWLDLRDRARRDPAPRERPRLPLWSWAALLVWLAPYLIQTLLPPELDWDTAMYHVPTAIRFLQKGITFVDPHQAQLNFPAAIPLLYAVFVAIGAKSALVPFNMIGVLVLVFAVHQVGTRHLSPLAGRIAAALLLTSNLLMQLGVDARNDGFLALYFFACAQGFFAFRENPARVGLLALIGMAMGMAHATKLTGLLAVALFGIAALAVLVAAKPRRGVSLLLVGIVCVIVPSGFFLARNAVLLGDPIYPFLNGLQYVTNYGETRDFYADFAQVYAAQEKPYPEFLASSKIPDEPGTILNIIDVLLHPERYQNRLHHWLQPLVFLCFLLPLVDRRRTALWISGLGVAGFLALGVTAHLTRYSLPALPLLALGAAHLLERVRPRPFRTPVWFWLVLGAVLGGYALNNSFFEWKKTADVKAFDYLSGSEPAYAWRIYRGYNGDPTAAVAAHKINVLIEQGKMSPDDIVLMAGEAKFDLIRVGTIPDMSVELNLWLTEVVKAGGDYRRIRENLRSIGVTHILINKQHIVWVLSKLRLDSKLQDRDYLRFAAFHLLRFLEDYATEVFGTERTGERASIELYRLT